MKIGISLTGVSYSTSGKRRDFRKTYKNFFETVYNPLKENNDVSLYLTTYSHDLNDELLKSYSPKKCQYIPYQNSHPRSTFMYGLCLVEEEDLDVLICTRFDIKFNQKITDLNVNYEKFNFLFKEKVTWDTDQFVTDNLFILPFRYFYDLADSIEELCKEELYPPHTFMHHIYRYIVKRLGEDNVHFIAGEEQGFSHDNRFYELVRTEQ
jgi:hypothetical protein